MEMITDEILAENGFYWRGKNGIKALICKPLEDAGFTNAFSTRGGGVSDFPENSLNLAGYDEDSAENIEENRRRFLGLFEDERRLASVWQVHGDSIKLIETYEEAETGTDKHDALISSIEGILLGVKTADCVPILIGDTKTRAFAAIHAGWRGSSLGIAKKAVEKMNAEFGSDPDDMICAIGPAAVNCYEIGQDVIGAFSQNFPDTGHLFTPTKEGHAYIDLHLANREQLSSTGIKTENIHTAPLCTMERTDLFFSYRKEKKKYGKTGRLMSVIGRS